MDSGFVFSTCGWQFANNPLKGNDVTKNCYKYDTCGVDQEPDLSNNILWSTDNGSYAKDPRFYFLKSKVDWLSAEPFLMLLISLDLTVAEFLKIDINGDCRNNYRFYDDSKYTISEQQGYYLLTHTFYEDGCHSMAKYSGKKPQPLKIFYVVDKSDYHIVDYSLSYEAQKAVGMECYRSNVISKSHLCNVAQYAENAIKAWKEQSQLKGTGSVYLEVVRGNCMVYIDDVPHITGEDLSCFTDPFSAYYAYCGVSRICSETGFNSDEGGFEDMRGKTAMCIVV